MQATAAYVLDKLLMCSDRTRVLRDVENMSPKQAWESSPHGQDLAWFLARIGLNRKALAMMLCRLVVPAIVTTPAEQTAARVGFSTVYRWAYLDDFSAEDALVVLHRLNQDQMELEESLHGDLLPRPELVTFHAVTLALFLMKQLPLFTNSYGQILTHYSWPITGSYASGALCQGAALLATLSELDAKALSTVSAAALAPKGLQSLLMCDVAMKIREQLAVSSAWQPLNPCPRAEQKELEEMPKIPDPSSRHRWRIHFEGVSDRCDPPQAYTAALKDYADTIRSYVPWDLVEDLTNKTLTTTPRS